MQSTSQTSVARHYNRMQIETASQSKGICMLHERCASLVASAVKSPEDRRLALDRAQNILAQLQAVLRIEDEVGEGLFFLYDYCYALLERGEEEDCVNAFGLVRHLSMTFRFLFRRG